MRDIETVLQLIRLTGLAILIIDPLDENNYANLTEITQIKLKFQQIDDLLTNLRWQHIINYTDDKFDINICQKCLLSPEPKLTYCKKVPCQAFKDRPKKAA
jgi:hypothetical protein